MCAIIGASFAPNSKIDRRALAHALLSEGQIRGRDAAGYGWVVGEEFGFYKKDVPAEYLNMKMLPRDASAMILHTRAATHGSPSQNENNHPVLSPSGDIMLVHNGVIYNHDEVRRALGPDGKKLPEVDSSVIPAVIELAGLASTDQMTGDAAAAWFDRETGDTLHLARFSHSPVAIATVEDGSVVFASTPDILARALDRVGLRWFGSYPEPFYSMEEGEYIQFIEGQAVNEARVEWGEDDYYGYGGWRNVTSGKTTSNTRTGEVSGGMAWSDPDDFEDQGAAYALTESSVDNMPPAFWLEDHAGDKTTFTSIATMAASLRWHAGLSGGEYDLVGPDDGELKWVNHFGDVGEIDQNDGEYISWVSKPNEMQDYGDSVPGYVRDGVDVLRKVMI